MVPTPDKSQIVHGLKDACADDALWLVTAIVQYIRETGDMAFAHQVVTYADGGEGTVYEHMKRILDFSARQVGINLSLIHILQERPHEAQSVCHGRWWPWQTDCAS